MAAPAETRFTIVLKLFAVYGETLGAEEQTLEVQAGTTASDVCDRLIAQYPSLAEWRSQTRFGINLEFVAPETPLQPGDELVLIPPVSGG
ncbi:MoaD/ThiS family protein [Synechococcus sp. PCC 7336]|uniref:MoaD/ThiS family protein n=1 Tax=Synechococcus sp. PCC 7336 TaxID=195250 RepID=UPI00034BD299|nr:MoaD/ThiS family protein [Synechococcus sp. PCC 7336]